MSSTVQPCGQLWFSNLQFYLPSPLLQLHVPEDIGEFDVEQRLKVFSLKVTSIEGGESQSEKHGDERGARRWKSVLDICYGPYSKCSIPSLGKKLSRPCPYTRFTPFLPLPLVVVSDCMRHNGYKAVCHTARRHWQSNHCHISDYLEVWCIWTGFYHICYYLPLPALCASVHIFSLNCVFNHHHQHRCWCGRATPRQWRMPAISLDTVQLW